MPYGIPESELTKLRSLIIEKLEKRWDICPQIKAQRQALERAKDRLFDQLPVEAFRSYIGLIIAQERLQHSEQIVLTDCALNLMVRLLCGHDAKKFLETMEKRYEKEQAKQKGAPRH